MSIMPTTFMTGAKSGPRQPLSMSIETESDPTRGPGLLAAFTPFAIWSPHFETDLEIIQNHPDSGDKAVVFSCEGQLKTCEPNPDHRRIVCALCRGRFRSGMNWNRGAGLSQESFYELSAAEETLARDLRHRTSRDLDEVRAHGAGRVVRRPDAQGAQARENHLGPADRDCLQALLHHPVPQDTAGRYYRPVEI